MKLLSTITVMLLVSSISAIGQTITGSGTVNYIPKFTGASVIGNSVIYNNGTNIGINTTNPVNKLEVRGSANVLITNSPVIGAFYATDAFASNPGGGIALGGVYTSTGGVAQFGYIGALKENLTDGNYAGKLVFGTRVNGGAGADMTRMTITSAGRVGIATTTPDANSKLDVNGNIYCRSKIYIGTPDAGTAGKITSYALAVNGTAIFTEAKVKLYASWPDFVFDDKYNLLPLTELEKFLKENKHLPNIPSAAEVAKNGLALGDMSSKLLEKVEELTLYLIDLKKENELLKKRLDAIELNKEK